MGRSKRWIAAGRSRPRAKGKFTRGNTEGATVGERSAQRIELQESAVAEKPGAYLTPRGFTRQTAPPTVATGTAHGL